MRVNFDDIGMVERVMNAKLICKLVLHLILFYGWLEDFFYSAEKASCFMHAYVHISKFARTYAFSQLKITNSQRFWFALSPVRK